MLSGLKIVQASRIILIRFNCGWICSGKIVGSIPLNAVFKKFTSLGFR